MTPSLRRDSALSSMLIDLDEQGVLQTIVERNLGGYQASMEPNSTGIKSLVDRFRTLSLSPPQQGTGAYNEQTCFPFHLLLVTAINGFRNRLILLRGDDKSETVGREAYVE